MAAVAASTPSPSPAAPTPTPPPTPSSAAAKLNPLFVDPLDETLPSSCADCGLELAFYGLLERHRVDVHGEDEILVCGKCANPFKRKMNLVFHHRSTSHRFIKFIGCDICDAFNLSNGFPDEENLAEHTAEVHGEDAIINTKELGTGKEYKCPLCKEEFKLRKAMMEHLGQAHLDHLYGDLLQAQGEIKEELMKSQAHACEACGRTFRLKSVFEQHKKSHEGKEATASSLSTTEATTTVTSPSKPASVELQQKRASELLSAAEKPAQGTPAAAAAESSLPVRQSPPVSLQQMVLQQQQQQQQLQPQERADLMQHAKNFQCTQCTKAFTSNTVLKMHMDMAHKVKKEGETKGGIMIPTQPTNKSQPLMSKTISLPKGTSLYVRGQQAATQPPGVRPMAPHHTILNKATTRILSGSRSSPGPGLRPMHLQSLAPRPKLPVGLPPLALAAKRTRNGSAHPRGRVAGASKANGGQFRGAKHNNSNGGGGGDAPLSTAGDSSEEDDEGLPRHANVIMKRLHNDDNDVEWTSRVKRASLGADGVRSSSRIRTKRDRSDEEARRLEQLRAEEEANQSPAESSSNGTATPKTNGASAKEIVAITRPYAPRGDGQDRAAELVEVCVIEGCERKFFSYQSMMRHVAFKHQPERTMSYMKMKEVNPPPPPTSEKEGKENGVDNHAENATTANGDEVAKKASDAAVEVKIPNGKDDDEVKMTNGKETSAEGEVEVSSSCVAPTEKAEKSPSEEDQNMEEGDEEKESKDEDTKEAADAAASESHMKCDDAEAESASSADKEGEEGEKEEETPAEETEMEVDEPAADADAKADETAKDAPVADDDDDDEEMALVLDESGEGQDEPEPSAETKPDEDGGAEDKSAS